MALGWKFPDHVFDLHTAFLAAGNILLPYEPDEKRKREKKKLPNACRAYGIEGWENIEKESIAKDIGEGRWQIHGRDRVLEYCEEDVKASTSLLREQLRGRRSHYRYGFYPADVERIIHWSNY